MSKQEGEKQIARLIEKYKNLTSAQRNQYNEANTRKNFILPLFESLGWDTRSDDVPEEERASGKRVDYAFKINGITKFFLEAKPFSINLDESRWAEQAIWYAYHKSVPWVVLTDFESIKVFNAEWDEQDAERSLVFEIPYKNYLTSDKLWFLSRLSIEKGELDEYAEKEFKKPKRVAVDKQLVADLLRWRDGLYADFSGYNPLINKKKIAENVQKVLNRIIFIRTCEDRGFEEKSLQEMVRNYEEGRSKSDDLVNSLRVLFREFDKNYDSKLFEDRILFEGEKFIVDDNTLAAVIKETYKGSKGIRWNFNDINGDVLGGIYEQYLGQIQREDGKEKKSSKRKSQGIYYTPRYIVDYIVENTLGEILKNKPAHEASKIKILDPACGSGSFLIKAFEVLDNHIRRKLNQKGDNWLINYARKFNILTSNIYGVDLDPEAVEIAQLNLLIKALEKRERLPNLSHNIECGNSLISGTETELKKYFGKNWKEKKSFNWEERFPDVFKQGGFDVIIGNPPYIKEDSNKSAFDGLHNSPYYQGKMDIWTLFACRAIDLLKDGGYFSFIAPSSWLTSAGASIFRDKILTEGEITKFIDFGDFRVFQDASIQTMIFIFHKKKPAQSYKAFYIKVGDKNLNTNSLIAVLNSMGGFIVDNISSYKVVINPEKLKGKTIAFSNDSISSLLEKIERASNFKLKDEDIGNGIDVLQDFVTEKHLSKIKDKSIKKGDGIFILKNDYINRMNLNNSEQSYLKPYYTPKQINRYLSLDDKSNYKIIYADKYFRENIKLFPNLKQHIDRFKNILTSAFAPYGLHRPREERFFNGEGIFVLRKTMLPAFTYVNFPCYVTRSFLILKPNDVNLKYLTGILNSKLIYFWLKNKGKKQGEQLQIDKEPLLQVPLFVLSDKIKITKIINLVDEIMTLNKKLQGLDSFLDEDEYKELKSEIQKTDKEIDERVYKLYGLASEEIKIVEGNKF